MNKLKTLVLLISLSFSGNSVAGDFKHLSLTDDEIREKSFSRVLGSLRQFYDVNKDDIKTLNQKDFFKNPQYSPDIGTALHHIRTNNNTYINQDYDEDPKSLRRDLKIIRDYFQQNKGQCDLDTRQGIVLLQFVNGLLIILNALKS